MNTRATQHAHPLFSLILSFIHFLIFSPLPSSIVALPPIPPLFLFSPERQPPGLVVVVVERRVVGDRGVFFFIFSAGLKANLALRPRLAPREVGVGGCMGILTPLQSHSAFCICHIYHPSSPPSTLPPPPLCNRRDQTTLRLKRVPPVSMLAQESGRVVFFFKIDWPWY